MDQKNIPEKKFSTGSITATIWKNPGKSKQGEDIEFSTITLQRRYKDKNNAWQSTNSLRVSDLPKATLVLNKAYEYLVLREYSNEQNSSTSNNNEEPSSIDEDLFEEIVM
jgi:hypothetical protein